jgi:hypothetical protein
MQPSSSAVPSESPIVSARVNSLLLSLTDASPVIGLTVWQMRGLVASGQLPVVRVGRKLYVRRATLARWAERAEGKHRT